MTLWPDGGSCYLGIMGLQQPLTIFMGGSLDTMGSVNTATYGDLV